ncbi:MAG TPA: dNTP triphosphohydrolase, partial [Chloroflexota bacterium]|nr:dNTP triphosphohydrolase [Chloroflexota bacterium]
MTPEKGKRGDEREPWEIDRARILHSAAFRRLQRKTQVFAPAEGDFFRTRLTHSIEVAQIAKGIALRVGADPTLCEAASLAHDIGHPPFGHAGERVLNECMAKAGGFEGNAQNLRVLATLEVKSDEYPGLNLTRATLDALLKYKRLHSETQTDKFVYDDDLPLVDWVCQGRRDERTSFECQIMDWSDEVAYSVHDLEDGMWGEVITRERLLSDRTLEAMHAAAP